MNPSQRTAIVIGGGLVGCATAYYLARDGWSVRLLERDRIGSGASSGNCGFICPSHVMPMAVPGAVSRTLRTMLGKDSPVAIKLRPSASLWSWLAKFALRCRSNPMMQSASARHALLKSSMELYRQLVGQEGLACQLQDQGLLMVYKSKSDFEHFTATSECLREEFGISTTRLVGDEVAEYEPALRRGLAGGWLFPGDAHVRPECLLDSLCTLLDKYKVIVEEGVGVNSLNIQEDLLHSVETSHGSRSADVVILATGAEAPVFAKPLQCRIPIQPGKGFSLTMPYADEHPKVPMIFEEHHVAVTPFQGQMRIGSTMEFAGYDRSLNQKRLSLLVRSAEDHLVRVPDTDKAEKWAGWRPMTYDGLPCIDWAPGAKNVIVAAGNGMIGLASAPATGKLVAQLASGEKPFIDPEPYSLRRFL